MAAIASARRTCERPWDASGVQVTTREETLTAGRGLQAGMVVVPARRAPRFTMVGLHWRGAGELWFRTAGGGLAARTVGARRVLRAARRRQHRGRPVRLAPRQARLDGAGHAHSVPVSRRGQRLGSALHPERASARPSSCRCGSARRPAALGVGADESLVRSEARVADELRVTLIHHTAGEVPATPDESAAIIRGIQRYHVSVNGWNDIGYNFLVDGFGQVFEGRAGGIERNVIGAHARGFNTGSVGVAVLGDYQNVGIRPEARAALVNLLAWRLDVAHVDPQTLPSVLSGGNRRHPSLAAVTLRAVSGHRDTDFTICPGDHLYAEVNAMASEAAGIGLPKLYEPRVEGALGSPVRFTARFSQELPWTVLVADELGVTVAQGAGVGSSVDWTWDASGDSEGRFNYAISAGETVRAATGTIDPPPPPPPPEPPPRPSGIPRRIPRWAWDMYVWHNLPRAERGRRPPRAETHAQVVLGLAEMASQAREVLLPTCYGGNRISSVSPLLA